MYWSTLVLLCLVTWTAEPVGDQGRIFIHVYGLVLWSEGFWRQEVIVTRQTKQWVLLRWAMDVSRTNLCNSATCQRKTSLCVQLVGFWFSDSVKTKLTKTETTYKLTQSCCFYSSPASSSRLKYPHMTISSFDKPVSRCYTRYSTSYYNYLWVRTRRHPWFASNCRTVALTALSQLHLGACMK